MAGGRRRDREGVRADREPAVGLRRRAALVTPSSSHTNVTAVASVAVNVNVADVPLADALSVGICGATVSIVKAWMAGVGSVPLASVAVTVSWLRRPR